MKEGKYKLIRDGQEIGLWNSKELGDGLNLATQIYTPEYQQAVAICEMKEEHWEIERRLGQYAWL